MGENPQLAENAAMPTDATSASTTARDEAVAWLFSRINYERTPSIPYSERQLKLDRMRQLATALGSPGRAVPIVHIAGTKGKGSTAAMLAAMLTAAGYRTGVFSSPHIERLEERLTIDGTDATGDQLAAVVEQVRPVVEQIDRRSRETNEPGPTFFDITTAIALVFFAEQQCDMVVLEVGLGGRLDSTNVCLPIVSVITSISLDHTKQLGSTLASIAREKAGIVKPGVPVVSGVAESEPRAVIAEVAREHGCRLIERGHDFDFDYLGHKQFDYSRPEHPAMREVELGLTGRHQAANAAVALAIADELNRQQWAIDEQACRQGLASVQLPGRFERVAGAPAVVIDTAHNRASAEALAETLAEEFAAPRTLVVACSKDKDIGAIASALVPAFDRVIVTEYQENPRAVPVGQLAGAFEAALKHEGRDSQVDIHQVDSPTEAWNLANERTPDAGVIGVAGSFYLAAELRPIILAERGKE